MSDPPPHYALPSRARALPGLLCIVVGYATDPMYHIIAVLQYIVGCTRAPHTNLVRAEPVLAGEGVRCTTALVLAGRAFALRITNHRHKA